MKKEDVKKWLDKPRWMGLSISGWVILILSLSVYIAFFRLIATTKLGF